MFENRVMHIILEKAGPGSLPANVAYPCKRKGNASERAYNCSYSTRIMESTYFYLDAHFLVDLIYIGEYIAAACEGCI